MKLLELIKPVIIGILVLSLIIGALFLCARWHLNKYLLWERKGDVPKEGLWYCEAIEMHLSFTDKYQSTVVIDGKTKVCDCWHENGSSDLNIEYYREDDAHKKTTICCSYVSLTEERYQIKNIETGEIYDFVRVK